MCGIAGVVRPAGIDVSELGAMAAALEHRGPDSAGYMLYGADGRIRIGALDGSAATVGFAHRRLTIIDLSDHSNQPMADADRELALTYNGEIYNYVELRSELEALGHRFSSSGDTEVVLRAYSEWGESCVERFIGMWAFAILDLRRGAVFLSRDRFGIKPLYYSLSGDCLRFASEIKGLLAVVPQPDPDELTVSRFLIDSRADEGERTFFEGISQLRPAHSLTLELGRVLAPKPRAYWEIPQDRVDRDDAPAELRELLADSIRLHARSDVPVGTCLSGGLDSSGIVCLAEGDRRAGRIPSYTHEAFGYVPADSSFSERGFMEMVVERTGVEMTYVAPSADEFVACLPSILRQQDEPCGSASIAAQWFVFRAAREAGVKVMLDGQGADEYLGGYLAYMSVANPSFSDGLRSRLPDGFRAAARSVRDSLRGRRWPAGSEAISGPLRERWAEADFDARAPRTLSELLARETRSTSLPALLRYEDRNSMAHSIEARVPFLDHRLVEFAFRLQDDWKIRGTTTKHVLREALAGEIPEEIRKRTDKVGFRADPALTWSLIDGYRESFLESRTTFERRWLDPRALGRIVDEGDRSLDREFLLWRVLSLKLWLRSVWGDGGDGLLSD